MTYAIYPHGETWKAAQTVKKAYFLNQPAYAVMKGADKENYSFVSVNQSNVVIETIKAAEDGDGVIVRVYESENARTKTVLNFGVDVVSAEECNLIEEKEQDVILNDNSLSFVMKPYEIKSFRIRTAK